MSESTAKGLGTLQLDALVSSKEKVAVYFTKGETVQCKILAHDRWHIWLSVPPIARMVFKHAIQWIEFSETLRVKS